MRNKRREKSTVARTPSAPIGRVDHGDVRPGENDRDAFDAVGFEHELHASGRRPARPCRASSRRRPSSAAYSSVARNGPGRGGVAGLFEEQAEVGRVAIAERGVFGEVPPDALVHARVVDVLTHQRGRALALHQLVPRVAEQFLVGGEGKVHYFLGSPSTRWAMMLRWISELPPTIVFANDMKKPCTKRSVGTRGERRVRAR